MYFKESKYFNEEFLGKSLYSWIRDNLYPEEIFTIQEFFDIYGEQKEYFKEGFIHDDGYYKYKLTIHEEYYELESYYDNCNFNLVFDKPVHITGEDCECIIAPEIVIKSSKNISMHQCITNKVTINNKSLRYYYIGYSKINSVYFYNSRVDFQESEIDNFFILKKHLKFDKDSKFLDYCQIKCFGECKDLKEKMLEYKHFKDGIIHIE